MLTSSSCCGKLVMLVYMGGVLTGNMGKPTSRNKSAKQGRFKWNKAEYR